MVQNFFMLTGSPLATFSLKASPRTGLWYSNTISLAVFEALTQPKVLKSSENKSSPLLSVAEFGRYIVNRVADLQGGDEEVQFGSIPSEWKDGTLNQVFGQLDEKKLQSLFEPTKLNVVQAFLFTLFENDGIKLADDMVNSIKSVDEAFAMLIESEANLLQLQGFNGFQVAKIVKYRALEVEWNLRRQQLILPTMGHNQNAIASSQVPNPKDVVLPSVVVLAVCETNPSLVGFPWFADAASNLQLEPQNLDQLHAFLAQILSRTTIDATKLASYIRQRPKAVFDPELVRRINNCRKAWGSFASYILVNIIQHKEDLSNLAV
jgi:hypothetical protein